MKKKAASVHWALALYTLVRDVRGRILLLQRSGRSDHFAGCWELPGGKPDPDETFDATAVREVFEESGLNVTLTGVAGAADGSVSGVRVSAGFGHFMCTKDHGKNCA